MDADIQAMTIEEAKEKLQEIRNEARWLSLQEGDDRCWLDDIKLLKVILPHGQVNFVMPSDLDFIQNCINFKKTRCPLEPKLHEW